MCVYVCVYFCMYVCGIIIVWEYLNLNSMRAPRVCAAVFFLGGLRREYFFKSSPYLFFIIIINVAYGLRVLITIKAWRCVFFKRPV